MHLIIGHRTARTSLGDLPFLLAMVSHLILTSGLTELIPFGDLVRLLLINAILVLSVYGIIRSAQVGYYLLSAISLILLISIWVYLYRFSSISGSAFNAAAGGLYFPGTLAALFALAIRRREKFLASIRSLHLVILLYSTIYIVLNFMFSTGLVALPSNSMLILGADEIVERAARVRLSTSFVCIGFALSAFSFFKRKSLFSTLSIIVFVVALFMANARGFSAFLMVAFLMSLFVPNIRMMSLAGIVLVVAGAAGSLYVAFTPGLDPLEIVDRDTSGRIRSLSIQIAQTWIEHFPLMGVGVPSGGAGYTVISNSTTFYPSDIGFIGIVYSHGLVGFFSYLSICFMACWSGMNMVRLGFDGVLARSFAVAGLIFSLYSLQAPVFLGQSGASLGALFIALALVRPHLAAVTDEAGARERAFPASSPPLHGGPSMLPGR